MKKLSIVSAVMGAFFVSAASAVDLTIYYSPNCPHCHHALDFIEGTLVNEVKDLKVNKIDVTIVENRKSFRSTIRECELKSGGVPIMVINGKCIQGYAEPMQDEIRDTIKRVQEGIEEKASK